MQLTKKHLHRVTQEYMASKNETFWGCMILVFSHGPKYKCYHIVYVCK